MVCCDDDVVLSPREIMGKAAGWDWRGGGKVRRRAAVDGDGDGDA